MTQLNNPTSILLKGIKVAYININRLINKHHNIVTLLEKFKYDLLFIAETWLDDVITDVFLSINSYRIIRLDRTYNTGGGILCYVRDNLNVSIQSSKSNINIEFINLLYHLKGKSKPILLTAFYRKPSSTDIFFKEFQEVLNVGSTYKNFFCFGDTNICSLSKKYPFSKIKNLCRQFNLDQIIKSPTHNKSCIDHIYTNKSSLLNINLYGTIDINYSDHKLIFFTIKSNQTQKKLSKFNSHEKQSNSIPRYKYSNCNIDNFLNQLSLRLNTISWPVLDISTSLETFINVFMNTANDTIPLKNKLKFSVRVDWLTPEYHYLSFQRNKYFKRFKKSNDSNCLLCYKYFRNKLNNLAKRLKSISISKKLSNKSPKIFWTNLKQILPTKGTNINVTNLIPTDDTFAKFFSQVASDIIVKNPVSKFNFSELSHESQYFKYVEHKFKFKIISHFDIMKFIKKLPLKYPRDTQGISPFLLKTSSHIVSSYLCCIFNNYISTNKFPHQFKTARVTPIYKSDNESNPSNYRPISILPCLSKIFENILHEQLSEFIESNKILSNHQFGFRKLHNANFAVLHLLNDILTHLNKNENILALFLDLKKAFDLVDHEILMYKLLKYSFDPLAIQLLSSYLSNRFIYVGKSGLYKMFHGVPQGSILGPLLFSLFINDLFLTSTLCSLICYADDTVVYLPISCHNDSIHFITEVNKIFNWFSENHLYLNYEKCNLINFYIKKNFMLATQSLQIANYTFNFTDRCKYLGIIIDNNLKFNTQYNKLLSVYGHYISIFKFLSKYISKYHLSTTYLAFILPIIEYCSTSYLHFSFARLLKLNKLNKFLLSFTVLDKHRFSLINRLTINTIKLVRKIEKGLAPASFLNCKIIHSLPTRCQITLPLVNKIIFRHSFIYWYNKCLINLNILNNLDLTVSANDCFDILYS